VFIIQTIVSVAKFCLLSIGLKVVKRFNDGYIFDQHGIQSKNSKENCSNTSSVSTLQLYKIYFEDQYISKIMCFDQVYDNKCHNKEGA
jgi:hypothetical protein